MEEIPAKTIVTRNKGTAWFGLEYNMNLYRGCCHGCIYCDSRSDCYGTGEFDRVRVKKDALRIVRDDLRRKVRFGVVGTGSMSDPYNPHEESLELTRHALELVGAYGFGAAVTTKSPLVTRDADILKEIAANAPVLVKVTVTAADDRLCRLIEPRAAPSSERLAAVAELSRRGIYTGILLMPVLPFLLDTDENITEILRMAEDAGARFVYPAFGVTLRDTQREHFLDRLEELFPGTEAKYLRQFGSRYQCASPRAGELYRVFQEECGKRGLLYKMQDIIRGYRTGYQDAQLTWF